MLINIIIGLAILSGLIIAHELGHFFTAKASGIRVDEFGLGFPPRLLSVRRGETRYSLNAILLGGFVKMAGEEDPEVPGSLASKGIGTRLLVLSAGSLVNILLPLLMLSIAFMVPHDVLTGQVVVDEVVPNSPAAMAGIEKGDIILSIDGKQINNLADLHRYVQLNLGRETALLLSRGESTTRETTVIPRWKPPSGEGAIGIAVRVSDPIITRQSYPFWKAIPMGVAECIETSISLKNAIISLIIGAVPVDQMTLVGVAQVTGEVAKTGINPLLVATASLSLILGIGNIFPLPALDGGRVAFVLLEWVRRGKRVSPKVEGLVHLVGFVMLMGFTLLIVYHDIARIVTGESLIP